VATINKSRGQPPPKFRIESSVSLEWDFVAWTIPLVIQRGGLTVIYGPPGAGKTFSTLDMIAAAVRDVPWRGREAFTLGGALYVAAEDAAGFRERWSAYELANGVSLERAGLKFVAGAVDLTDPTDVGAFIADVRTSDPEGDGFDTIIFDPLACCMASDPDENASGMAKALEGVRRIMDELSVGVWLVHHSGHDVSKGPRGSTRLMAAVDTAIAVTRSGGRSTARVVKQKNGATGAAFPFELRVVSLPKFETFHPERSSCVVDHLDATSPKAEPDGPLEQLVVAAVRDLGADALEVAVVKRAAGRLPPPPPGQRDRRKFRSKRALKALIGRGALCEKKHVIFCVEHGTRWNTVEHEH
jgi:hypothetical protein